MGYFYLASGIILFILGVISAVRTGGFNPKFYLFTFIGLGLVLWGVSAIRKTRRTEIKDQTRVKVDRIAGVRAVPMKRCPACGGEIESRLHVCPVCNHRFKVVYTLTVFAPFNVAKREQLIKYLATRMNKPYEEVSIQLEKGMIFRYSGKDDMDKSRASFESLGCSVKVGEIVQDE
jgi:hypothetical protein